MYDLTKVQDISGPDELIDAIKTLYDPELQLTDITVSEYKFKIKAAAKKLGLAGAASEMLKAYENVFKPDCSSGGSQGSALSEEEIEVLETCRRLCKTDSNGRMLSTIDNYCIIMENDPMFSTLRLNELTSMPEFKYNDSKYNQWTDDQDSIAVRRMERICEVYSQRKYEDAIRIHTFSNRYHPIKEIIEPVKWDGISRIPYILSKWMGVEDNEYTREVSRLIFAGGINRIYKPGIKFDEMPVLIGKQGSGKSTFVRWLALEDRFFGELTTTDEKRGGEAVGGKWIMEVAELLALTRTKEQEETKAFLSRQDDYFRGAFDRRPKSRLRTCIFIGTSNREQFITDKTGGRRFYPVYCTADGKEFGRHEEEFKEYALQCWAEALAKIDTDFMATYSKREVQDLVKEAQEGAMEEDYRIGMIQAFLDRFEGERVCLKLLWDRALNCEHITFSKADQAQLGMIMAHNINGWEKSKSPITVSGYGQQRAWVRKPDNTQIEKPMPNYWTPY